MDCRELSQHLSDLAGLSTDQERAAGDHAAQCPTCGPLWQEALSLDRLLQRWQAPSPPRGLADRILEELRQEPEVDCELVASQIHAFVADDLSPPESEAIEAHLEECGSCTSSVAECLRLAQVIRTWDAPHPARDLADRVRASLVARSRRTIPGGTVQMPRLLAALLVVAAALGVANLIRDPGAEVSLPTDPVVAELPGVRGFPEPSLRSVSLMQREPGGFDVAASFGDGFVPARGHLLREARRGMR